MAEVIDDFGEAEETCVVEEESGDPGDVDAAEGVAFVHEGFVVERGDR